MSGGAAPVTREALIASILDAGNGPAALADAWWEDMTRPAPGSEIEQRLDAADRAIARIEAIAIGLGNRLARLESRLERPESGMESA